jgi:hypothetical protein
MQTKQKLFLFCFVLLLLVNIFIPNPTVKGQEPEQHVFGNPSLPSWKNITVTVAGDGKSFTLDNADNLTWTFQYGAKKYDSIYQNGVQIVKDEVWMLQVYDGSWKDIGSSVNVFYEQVTSYNVRVIQSYTSANGDYNVTWNFYGGYRPKISFVADIKVAGTYRVDWRTYVYKDYAENMTNYVRFWNSGEEAIVFDYSDVYQAFGNITSVEGIDGWVKGKRFDLIFNVGSLPIGVFGLDPNFGYETKGGSQAYTTGAYIVGSKFYCPESGTAQSITVYLTYYAGYTSKIKCAIYSDNNGYPNALVGYTEEWTVTEGYDNWKTFNIVNGGSLSAGYYWIVFWSNTRIYYYQDNGDTNQKTLKAATYDGFPNPLPSGGTQSAYKVSIYCTYTTGGGVQEYSFTLSETLHATANLNIQQEHTYTFTGTIIQSSILEYGAEAMQILTQIITPTETVTTWQEHSYNFIETATPTTSLFYSVEGIQEFIETLTQTVTSSGTTYYWMELSYALTETAKPTATHSYGLEGIYTLIQTITPTETRIILQEQLYTLTQTTTLQTTLTYAGELAEVFITNIETITLQETIQYWIQRVELPINWGLVALCASILAFSLATAAIASQKTSESD